MNATRATCLRFLVLAAVCAVLAGRAQAQSAAGGCLPQSAHTLSRDAIYLWKGIDAAPRNFIRPRNLKWELPIAGATAALIAGADTPASRRIQSKSLQDTASAWSNAGLGVELGAGALAFATGCSEHRPSVSNVAFTALEASGMATAITLLAKKATNRQRPYRDSASGEMWEGGDSFPSGHATASFAFASVIAHRTHKRWLQIGVFGLAAGVSLARYPAKQHFLSDILVGGTLGYVTGTYLAR